MKRIPTARELKEQLQEVRSSEIKATLKDIEVVIQDNFPDDEVFDFTRSQQTKLYNEHGGEYCTLLELLVPYKKNYYSWYK